MIDNRDDYAIVIGIDHYGHLPPLQTAVADATRFSEWLRSPDGGGLPAQNVRTLLSRPVADPAEASPRQLHVDRYLRDIGLVSNRQVGRRLYFYFAGRGFGPGTADTGLLLADAGPDKASNLHWGQYQFLMENSGAFEELFCVADIAWESASYTTTYGAPFLTGLSKEQPAATLAIINRGIVGIRAFESPAASAGDDRGLLTEALLSGLQGAAADATGEITAFGLSNYLTRRVGELAVERGIEQRVEIIALGGDMVVAGVDRAQLVGTVVVEVPHWTCRVRIHDGQYRAVSGVGAIMEDPDRPGHYFSKTPVTSGIYQVEATLEEQSERQLVFVAPGAETRLARDSWKQLHFTPTAPLATATAGRKNHMRQAEKSSRKITWQDAPPGDARLFLFVRTEQPDEHPAYAEGLKLLDEDGQLVTDFSHGVRKNRRGGWLACTADLPAGHYILRRGRRGVPVRYQSLYLCAHWETHLFLVAKHNYPSLADMTLFMARRGSGFEADDAKAELVEVVLESLRRPVREAPPIARERISALLEGKFDDPWLGILAAYALRRKGRPEDPNDAPLLERVLAFLSAEVPDHPDVRALNLVDAVSVAPFWHPPLLRDGLMQVVEHATRQEGTLPPRSLTEMLLDHLLVDSPWTAWSELDETPLYGPSDEPGKARKRAEPVEWDVMADWSENLQKTLSPKAPVYHLAKTPAQALEKGVTPSAAPATRSTLYNTALIQSVQGLTTGAVAGELPEKVTLDFTAAVGKWLEEISPELISQASGLSLDRTQESLDRLRQGYRQVTGAAEEPDPGQVPLSSQEETVFTYALQQQSALDSVKETSWLWLSDSDVPVIRASAVSKNNYTIEEIVGQLNGEASRLMSRVETGERDERARTSANLLRESARILLMAADFVVLTDEEGRITFGNGAFRELLRGAADPSEAAPADQTPVEAERTRQEAWENALRELPPGRSQIADPIAPESGREWLVQRSLVEDASTRRPQTILNVMRRPDVGQLAPERHGEIESLLSEMKLYSSLYAYGSEESIDDSLAHSERLSQKIHSLVA